MFDWWWEFLYNISYWINQLLDIVYKLFLFFSGSAPAEVNMEFTGRADGNVLADVFSLNTIPIWFLGFVLIAGTLFLICIIIAMLRSEWAKDNKEAKIKVIISTAKGIMILLFIPAIFGISIMATTTIMGGLVDALGGTAESDYSFAQQLFECCYPSSNGENWNNSFHHLSDMLKSEGKSMQDYNYLVAYVGGLIMLFTVGISAITVIGRIIELVLLYVISPVVVAVSPLDEGNRLGIWKDLVISKFLSVAGMIICYYIFFLIMGFVNKEMFTGNNFTIKIAKLLFAIAGCLTANKGGLLITNLVGHNSALIEGQQQGIVGQTVSSGMFAGLKVVGTLATSSVHILRNGASTGANMLSGALSTRNASNNVDGTTPFANMDGGTGIREASNVATMVSNAQNGSTFTEKANTYTDGKNQAEGGNNKPLGDMNKGTEPTNNAGETMREGKGFGGITPPPTSKSTVDVAMPDSPTVMETSEPSVMPTADASIKGIIEEGKKILKSMSR